MCGKCKNENCFKCKGFRFVFEELINTNVHKMNTGLKLNILKLFFVNIF